MRMYYKLLILLMYSIGMRKNFSMTIEKLDQLFFSQMEVFIKDNGLSNKILWMDVEFKYGQMDLDMMDSGKMVKRTDMVGIFLWKQISIRRYVMNFISLDLKIYIPVILKMINIMETVLNNGLMDANMKEISKIISNKVKASIHGRMAKYTKATLRRTLLKELEK